MRFLSTLLRGSLVCSMAVVHAHTHAAPAHAASPAEGFGPLKAIALPAAVQPAPGSDAECSDRVVDARRVRHFWSHAVESPASDFQRDFDLADCVASAGLQWRGGTRGRLHLHDATGWGVLESKGTTRYFYCSTCEGILSRDFRPGAAR